MVLSWCVLCAWSCTYLSLWTDIPPKETQVPEKKNDTNYETSIHKLAYIRSINFPCGIFFLTGDHSNTSNQMCQSKNFQYFPRLHHHLGTFTLSYTTINAKHAAIVFTPHVRQQKTTYAHAQSTSTRPHLPLGSPRWPLNRHAPFMADTRPELHLEEWKKFPPPKPGEFGQHKVGSCVEVVLGCRVLH